MKKILSAVFVIFAAVNVFAIESNFEFDFLPKTTFKNENSISGVKGGLKESSGSGTKNASEVAMPDKTLSRGFDRYKKVDAFGDELPDSFLFYRSVLTENQKSAYDEILKAIVNGKDSVTMITRILESELEKIDEAVYYDNPEIFWYTGSYYYYYNPSTKYVTSIRFNYIFPIEDIPKMQHKFQSMSFPIIFYAAMLDDDLDKIKYVHDYLCVSVEYDYDSFNSGNYGGKLQTAYSTVCEYKTVCAGYSRAMAYYMQQLHIPCVVMHGSGHAWNFIKVSGNYYQMDVTWDDGNVQPPYFFVPHAKMQTVNMHKVETENTRQILATYPTNANMISYSSRFGTTPIGSPYTYREFNNIKQDIQNPLYAQIIKK